MSENQLAEPFTGGAKVQVTDHRSPVTGHRSQVTGHNKKLLVNL